MKARAQHGALAGIVPILVVAALWEAVARLHLSPGESLLPPFSGVVVELWRVTTNGLLARNFFPSLGRVVAGLLGAILVGGLVGVAMGYSRRVNAALGPIISLLYPIPALGWLPLLMVWIGISECLPVAVIFVCSFFPICYTTANGIRNVDHRYVNAARSLGSSELRILVTVLLPLAVPEIFTGLRLEAGTAWRVVIAAEMVAIPSGIGALLMRSESLVRVDTIMACLMVLSIMCLVFERLLLLAERRMSAHWA